MTKIPGFEGSYVVRSNGTCQVKVSFGWSEELGDYDVYRETVKNEAEAFNTLKEITRFIAVFGKNKKEFERQRRETKEEKTSTNKTFREVSDEFIRERRRDKDIAKRTVDTNETHIKRLNNFIGDCPIAELSEQELQKLKLDLRDETHPANKGRSYSGTYIQKVWATLSQVLDYAVFHHYVESNNTTSIKNPKRDTEEKKALTPAVAQQIVRNVLTSIKNPFIFGLFLIIIAGIRISEMIALRWTDYDDETNCLTISHSMERDTQIRKKTKNEEIRVIPLMPLAAKPIAAWKKYQKEWFKSKGLKWSRNVPMAHSPRAAVHILSTTYEKWWRNNFETLGIPKGVTPHSMRHTFATFLIVYCDVDPVTAQALTGHKNLDVLMKIYAHTHTNAKIEAMERLEDFLFPYEGEPDCAHCAYWSVKPFSQDRVEGVCWAIQDAGKLLIVKSDHICHCDRFENKSEGKIALIA